MYRTRKRYIHFHYREMMTSINTDKTECSLTLEELNFLRTANLILRVAPHAVRIKFDKEFAPSRLQLELNKARYKVLEPLKKKKVINQAQWNSIFPASGTALSKTFDLTLLICLIRHLTPIPVSDSLPIPTDISEGADLSRLKYYRNKITHCDDGVLSDNQLNDYWTDISQAIERLGGNSLKQKCDELKVCKLDNNDREIITEIRNIERSHDPIPKGLKGIHIEIIKEWEKQKVVETRAIKHLIHLTKKANTVVAVGSSGCGKSTAIQYVALMLHHQQGFEIVPVPTPDYILQYFNPEHRQVFVVDDICGKSTIDINLINTTGRMSLEIKSMLKSNTVKILSSCRTHIYQDRIFKNIVFMATAICNLTSDFCLTKSERLLIAEMYLTNEEVKKIQVKIFEMYDFFPLLCNLFTKQTGKDVVAFFSNPVQIIIDDLQLLFNSSDQTTFATLFLFIAYNNDLHENLLSVKSDIKQVLAELFDNFQLQSNLSFQVIKYEIEKLCEAYIKKCRYIQFLHDKLFTIFASFCGKLKFDLVLNIAHTEVVRDRFMLKRLITEEMDTTEHFITIPETKETQYFERLLKDINDGFVENIFLNTQLKYAFFRQQLIKFLLDSGDIHKTVNLLNSEKLSTLLMSMARQGFSDMLTLLLSEHVDVNCNTGTDPFDTPLYIASSEGFVDTVKILLEHKANTDIMCIELKTSIYVATENGFSDIVKLLLYHKANPNIINKIKITALYVAVLNGNTSIVELLLSNNADPNIGSWGNVTPLIEASRNGHTIIVKLLLEYNADPNLKDKYNRIPLDIASEKGNPEIASLLLKYKSEINHRDEENVTPLLRALMSKNMDTAKILLENGASIDMCNDINMILFFDPVERGSIENGVADTVLTILKYKADRKNICGILETALFVASEKCFTNVVEFLLNHKANPNIESRGKIAPLYIASLKGHVAIVKLLLSHKANPNTGIVTLLLEYDADPNLRDKYSRIPLDIASEKGYTEIVSLLLKYKSETNHSDEDNVTPLLRALMANHTDTAKVLLEYGADYNICNEINITPFFVAIEKDNTEIVNMMLQYEVGENIKIRYDTIRFYLACKKGDITTVNSLIEQPIKVNSNDNEFNHSALHVACSNGHSNIVKILLNKNCDINIRDKYGATSLFISSFLGRTDIVKLLLDYEAHVNTIDIFGDTPVLVASMKGQIEIVRLLLTYKCDANIRNRRNETALYNASRAGNTDIVKLLIEHTDHLDMTNKDNETALYVASRDGNADIVHLLLQKHCNQDICNIDDKIPLLIACHNDHIQVVKLLLQNYWDQNIFYDNLGNALFISCTENRIHIMRLLLQHIYDHKKQKDIEAYRPLSTEMKGVDYINNISPNNQTCLDIVASHTGNIDILKLLIECKADLNICSPLCSASANGSIDIVNTLLKHNADPNICNNDKETSVYIAALRGHTEIVQLLLKYECNSNICNEENETPLFVAASEGNVEIVKMLLKHKCDPNICNTKHETPLFIAVACDHLEVVKLLLKESYRRTDKCQNNENMETGAAKSLFEQTCDSNIYNLENETPLFRASRNGNAKIVKLLLENNSDPNICNNKTESPLFIASCYNPNICYNDKETSVCKAAFRGHTEIVQLLLKYESASEGNVEIVKMLLKHKCDPNICNTKHETPLFIAVARSYLEVVKILLKERYGNAAFRASFEGFSEVVGLLLEHNCDPNICNKYEETPLHIAAAKGYIDVVRLLLKYKCDLNICNTDMETPLLKASNGAFSEIVELLLHNDCDANLFDKDNITPLYCASYQGQTEIAKLLLDYRCKIEVCDETDASPLYAATYFGHTEIVKYILNQNTDNDISIETYKKVLSTAVDNSNTAIVKLLMQNNCNPNICNDDYETPLSTASKNGRTDIVRLLLIYKCDPNICNKDSESPLFKASFEGFSEIVELLLQNNCDPNLSDKYNQSPLHIASRRGHTGIVELLLRYNCNSSLRTQRNESALDIASELNHTEIMLLLKRENKRIRREEKKKCKIS
ncbi:unnamed protein product [Mytilus edulis]|uniref:DZIP3-like HEPN domain-containing protein n=1 Tax=Mytilus edulis TaxID=6550 RepID=A0A8S3TS38_MYTED|nr:unnamed protein product [Mytilus edulis]